MRLGYFQHPDTYVSLSDVQISTIILITHLPLVKQVVA